MKFFFARVIPILSVVVLSLMVRTTRAGTYQEGTHAFFEIFQSNRLVEFRRMEIVKVRSEEGSEANAKYTIRDSRWAVHQTIDSAEVVVFDMDQEQLDNLSERSRLLVQEIQCRQSRGTPKQLYVGVRKLPGCQISLEQSEVDFADVPWGVHSYREMSGGAVIMVDFGVW